MFLLAFHLFQTLYEVATQGKLTVHHSLEIVVEILTGVDECHRCEDVHSKFIHRLFERVDELGNVAGVIEFVANNSHGIQALG